MIRDLPRPILAVSAGAAAYILQREYPLAKMAQVLETLLAESVVNSIILLGDQNARIPSPGAVSGGRRPGAGSMRGIDGVVECEGHVPV